MIKNKFLSHLYILALLLIVASLTGCGSDGDSTPSDTTAPVVTLTGDATITVFQNTTYTDEGASATDDIDGALTVTVTGTVNTAVLGDYTIDYTATDAAGNLGTSTRTVSVVPVTLQGTAAGGAAIVGTVVVKGANGNVKSSLIEADGSYEVDVTGLTAPYRLRAEGTVGGKRYKLHSYTEEASLGGTVNITPFTDLIIANTAKQLAENFFDSVNDISLDSDLLDAQEDALQAKLQDVFDALGLDAAINLLNTSFSADHSGLDAALDLIQIENTAENIVTITNILDGSSITDDITAEDDNDDVLVVDADDVQEAVGDTQAIANLFSDFASEFALGLPMAADINDFFADDFLQEDMSKEEFFTDILTDDELIGISFVSVSVVDLDPIAGTATVFFNISEDDNIDDEVEKWFVIKHETLGWQLLGNQQIVEMNKLNYHCNDYDGTDDIEGACGINVSLEDNNFNNNGTNGQPILSATVSIISGENGAVKDMFYLGTAEDSSEIFVYDEGQMDYSFDWRAFGDGAGQISASVFAIGDTIEYNLYVANLDLTDPAAPMTVGDAIATYTDTVAFLPATVGKYPEATDASVTALNNFAFGGDITFSWTLAEGTHSDEILLQIDSLGGGFVLAVWESLDKDATSFTIDADMINDELSDDDIFTPSEGYDVIIRIYADEDNSDQNHSTDYRTTVEPFEAPDPAPQGLTCDHESGWDDNANSGMGAPINPNSFAEYNEVITDCGVPETMMVSDLAGKTFSNVSDQETFTFNDGGSATEANPSSGLFSGDEEEITFNWYIETVNQITYIVIESDSTLDADLPAEFWFRDTFVVNEITGTKGVAGATYKITYYTEQSNFSNDDRATGSDGEIWNTSYVLQ